MPPPNPKPAGLLSPDEFDDSDDLRLPAHEPSSSASPFLTLRPLGPLPDSGAPLTAKLVPAALKRTAVPSDLTSSLTPPPVARKPPQWRSKWLWSIGAAVLCIFAFAVFWIAINYKRGSDNIAEMPSIPASGVLTPREAVYHIGEKRTVEFTVGHRQQGDEWAYLYESAPSHADLQFRVAISNRLIATMRKRGSHWPYVLDGALLRVEGPITRNGKFAEIQVGDIDQFHKIVHAE
jgi:hypothetical protein